MTTELIPYPRPDAARWMRVKIVGLEERRSEATGKDYASYQLQLVGTDWCVWLFMAHTQQAAWRWKKLYLVTRDLRRKRLPKEAPPPEWYVGKSFWALLKFEEHWHVKDFHHIKEAHPDVQA